MIIYLNLSHYVVMVMAMVVYIAWIIRPLSVCFPPINMNPFSFGYDDCCGNQINLLQSSITSVFDVANSFVHSIVHIHLHCMYQLVDGITQCIKSFFLLSLPPHFHFVLFLSVRCVLHSTSLLATEVTVPLFVPFSILFVLTFGIFYTTHLS